MRSVGSSVGVSAVLGIVLLAYDVALDRGVGLPGGDLRLLALALDVALILVVGSVVTYLVVPLPRGSGERSTRTAWSAALGLFAAIPIAYLQLVIVTQILEPLLS
ncbi:MAG TPA: hypothetical protein VKR30_10160 [Candidatus Limnocylindrales bacterium]|nr:hypothetical protein [Candidatus Limnocylindrales bacterium]